MTVIKVKSRIPKFKNIEEEAHFWDTHDTTDFEDEFKPVKVKFAKNLSEGITVRFDSKSLNEIRRQANKKGVGPTTLVRMWVLKQLNHLKQEPRLKNT